MDKYCLSGLLILCCSAWGNRVFCQAISNDPQLPVTANMVSDYQKAIGPQSQIYRGPMYEFYNIQSIGNAYFFDAPAFSNGTVKYDGIVYKDVPLIYDEYGQLLITLLYNNYTKFTFLNDRLSEFDLHGHHFIRFQPDESNKKMEVGFYDELYNNKLQLLVKRIKAIQQDPSTTQNSFEIKNTYYLKKGTQYFSVNSQGQVLDVLNDKKKEIKQYLKDNKISFSKKNKEEAIMAMVTYYDRITN